MELYSDAAQVEANASLDSLVPCFAVEAHLGDPFADPDSPSDAAASGDLPRELPGVTSDQELAPTRKLSPPHGFRGQHDGPRRRAHGPQAGRAPRRLRRPLRSGR